MADYWKSNPRKFCDACKCWIADNKSSIQFHESGRKHQFNVQNRLSSIRHRASQKEKKEAKEGQWLEQMEKAALSDYRTKDLAGGSDLTARIFNEKKLQVESIDNDKDGGIAPKSTHIGPQRPNQPEIEGSSNLLRKIDAPTSGTKWHKVHGGVSPNKWYEARSEDGHVFYWNVETMESKWELPTEGFLSIQAQEEINKDHESKEYKKLQLMYKSQEIHGRHIEEGPSPLSTTESNQPYGSWQAVERLKKSEEIDFQAPSTNYCTNTAIIFDRKAKKHEFKKKIAPTIGCETGHDQLFKKRKIQGKSERKERMRKRTLDE